MPEIRLELGLFQIWAAVQSLGCVWSCYTQSPKPLALVTQNPYTLMPLPIAL